MMSVRVILLISLAMMAQCDLPVHCLKSQIVGKWLLERSEVQIKGKGILNCGHEMPDSETTSYKAGMKHFKAESHVKVFLSEHNRVHLHDDEKDIGSWTMVYDEGFEIRLDNFKYFAFSKYGPKKNGGWDSFCDETLIGWYHNTETEERGCYRAQKIEHDHKHKASEQAHNGHVVQPKLLELVDQEQEVVLSPEVQERMVEKLNKKGISWVAKTQNQWNGLTFSQINRRAGTKKFIMKSLIEENEQNTAGSTPNEEKYRHYSREDLSDLPKEFSWIKFLGPVREQKDCGSCYAISTMEMLSARLRIQGHDVTLSPQQSLDCNSYNQGCEGGYPFLVEKFSSENHLVDEKHYQYTAVDGKCKQDQAIKESHTTYGVKHYRFIGGAYGKSTEKQIMEEIHKNGPVVMNFEPEFDIMFYGGGVYHSVPAAEWILKGEERPEWEKVDHSVLCYGWGEEKGEKYWLLQNSWGIGWGEEGFFKMRRGTDESAIESMAEAAIPYVIHSSKSAFLQHQS